MARTKTKTKRTLKVKGISFTTAKLKSALSKVSKRTLMECFMILFRAAPKRIQLRVAIKLEKAPKKSTTKKRKTRKVSKRKSSKIKRKSSRKKTRTAKQRAATKKLVAFNKKRRR